MAFLLKKIDLTTGRARKQHFPWPPKAGECLSATKAHVDVLSLCPCAVPTIAGPVPTITWHHVGNTHFPEPYGNVLLVPGSRS